MKNAKCYTKGEYKDKRKVNVEPKNMYDAVKKREKTEMKDKTNNKQKIKHHRQVQLKTRKQMHAKYEEKKRENRREG